MSIWYYKQYNKWYYKRGRSMERYTNKIAYLRERRGLTQEDLAARLGISRASLSHYETGRRQSDHETLKKIASFFHVSIDYLLDREDQPAAATEQQIQQFVSNLELSDETILDQFDLTIDGQKLTAEEAKRFIAFIRAHRSMNE